MTTKDDPIPLGKTELTTLVASLRWPWGPGDPVPWLLDRMNKEQTLAVIKEYAKAQEAIKKAEADFYGKIAKM